MKFLITAVSSLIVGLALASSNFQPIREVQNVLANKRRLLAATVLAACGFVFVMSALILSIVEWALQYEAQGFAVWSALFSAAFGLFCIGVIAVLSSSLILSRIRAAASPALLAGFEQNMDLAGMLEHWLRRVAPPPSATEKDEKISPVRSRDRDQFADTDRTNYTAH